MWHWEQNQKIQPHKQHHEKLRIRGEWNEAGSSEDVANMEMEVHMSGRWTVFLDNEMQILRRSLEL